MSFGSYATAELEHLLANERTTTQWRLNGGIDISAALDTAMRECAVASIYAGGRIFHVLVKEQRNGAVGGTLHNSLHGDPVTIRVSDISAVVINSRIQPGRTEQNDEPTTSKDTQNKDT